MVPLQKAWSLAKRSYQIFDELLDRTQNKYASSEKEIQAQKRELLS